MIYLREVKVSDANDLFKITSNKNVTKTLTWYPHETIDETVFVIKNIYLTKNAEGLPNSYAIVLKNSEQVIGIIDFHYLKSTPAIGYFLNEDYWGRGIMTLALAMILKIGFLEYSFEKIEISHYETNHASGKVIIKNGFKYQYSLEELRKNELKILKYYQLTRSDYLEKQS